MNNTNITMLQEIFQMCIIPLLGILTAYLVKFINVKAAELSVKSDNDLATKYITMLSETITTCVIATNQTYVNSLKQQNAFTVQAQKEAFEKTKEAVLTVLSDDAKKYLSNIYGDLDAYLATQIEATVNLNRV